MQSKLHWNVVYHGVELLLLVSMLSLLAISKSLLILKEFLYTCFQLNKHRTMMSLPLNQLYVCPCEQLKLFF